MIEHKVIALTTDRAQIYISGDIGNDWAADQSVEAKQVVSAINDLAPQTLDIVINSFGGVVADGVAIANAIREYPGATHSIVSGVAASIASLFALAADRVSMRLGSLMMLHGPMSIAAGNEQTMRKAADMLAVHRETMLDAYAAYTGGTPSRDQLSEWLVDGNDHWFKPSDAIDVGLIDGIVDGNSTVESDATASLAAIVASGKYRPIPAEIVGISMSNEGTNTNDQPGGKVAQNQDAGAPKFLDEHSKIVEAAKAAGASAEAMRRREIEEVFAHSPHYDPLSPVTALYDQCIGDVRCDRAQATAKLLELLQQQTSNPVIATDTYHQSPIAPQPNAGQPLPPLGGWSDIAAGADGKDKFVEGAVLALSVRCGLEHDEKRIDEAQQNEFLSMSLSEIARASARQAGHRIQGSSENVLRTVIAAGPGSGTDHFPAILENIANKAVMDGYTAAPESWNTWTQPGTLNDYREASRVNKSLFSKLDKMLEHQPFAHGQFADVKEKIQGFLHGKEFSLTLQSMVNDDLGMLTGEMRAWGESANATIGDAVFLTLSLSGTGGYGQVMTETGNPLFHADHNNYIASGSGGPPDEATIGAARTAMMTQTDPNNRIVASLPRYLVHGTPLTMSVRKLLQSTTLITGQDITQGDFNPVTTLALQPIEEYRIDGWVSTAWFLAAAARTVEVAFVQGQRTPRVDRMQISAIPGLSWQISIPFGVAALDYRTLHFNYGA